MIGKFTSLSGKIYEVQIGTESGSLTLSEDPLHISWQKGDHIYNPIITVSATIKLRTTSPLTQLYAVGPFDIPVIVREWDSNMEEDTIIFDGFLTPQQWDAPDTGIYDEVELEAVDRLSALKYVNYTRTKTDFGTTHELSLPTFEDIIDHAKSVANISNTSQVGSFTFSLQRVNEFVWLPKNTDASIHSKERTSWTKVLSDIATFYKATFVYWGNTLYFIDVDYALETDTPLSLAERGTGSAGTGITSSIEPAKSSIVVKYGDTAKFSFSPDISGSRIFGSGSETTVSAQTSGDNEYSDTIVTKFRSKDWINTTGTDYDSEDEPSTHLPTIAHLLSNVDSYTKEYGNDEWCIVGPCHLKADARRFLIADKKVLVTWEAWYGANCGVYSKDASSPASNNTPFIRDKNGNVTRLGLSRLNDNEELEDIWENKPGFQSISSCSNVAMAKGMFDIFIPTGWCVKSITVEQTGYEYQDLQMLADEQITSISDDYNDQLEVESALRPVGADPICQGDVYMQQDKYPFVNYLQFSAPRPRIKAEIKTPSSLTPFIPCKSDRDNVKRYWPESADIDLRNGKTLISIIQTHEGL